MRLRIFLCDGCGTRHEENAYGEGASGWCGLSGILMETEDGHKEEPIFCPKCKERLVATAQALRDENGLD